MYLIFGSISIRSKKLTSKEVGINSEDNKYKNYLFLIKKRCFHVFWIPFFPIETLYFIKSLKTKEEYVMPDDFAVHVRTLNDQDKRHMIWSYLGIWLILGGILLIIGAQINKHFERNTNYTEYAKSRATQIDTNTIGTNYTLLLSPEKPTFKRQQICITIISVSDDSLEVVKMYGYSQYDSIKNLTWYDNNLQETLLSLARSKDLESLKISKEDLKKTIPTDRNLDLKQSHTIPGIGEVSMQIWNSYR
jgi:hypothetical protein